MDLAVAQEFRILQARDQPQHASLFAELQVILKSNQVVGICPQIFTPQLHHRPRRLAGSRIAQADRLHRAKAWRIAPSSRKLFDRQAAFKVSQLLPFFFLHRLRRHQRIVKAVILLRRHGAVDVVSRALVPACCHVHPIHIDRLGIHDWADGVIERKVLAAR